MRIEPGSNIHVEPLMRTISTSLFFLLLLKINPCFAFEAGQEVLFKMHGDLKLGIISEVDGRDYFINELNGRINYAKDKAFSKRSIQEYKPVDDYNQKTGIFGLGKEFNWSVGDSVMLQWNGGLQKGTIGDLTEDGYIYFSNVSRANSDSFGLGNEYFPVSIIRNRYESVEEIEDSNQVFRRGDTVLLYDKYSTLYDDQDLYEGKIIDMNSDGEVRIDYLHKRGRFFSVSAIRHTSLVESLEHNGKSYSLGQSVKIKWNGGTHKTEIIKIDSSGYVLVEKFRYSQGYISISSLIK
jgi:hypothetical protein